MVLNIKNLSAGYGKEEIIKNISLSVRNKEFIGIIGPNGSGKSTLLKTITGITNILNGSVSINGRDSSTLSKNKIAREISVVKQTIADVDVSVRDYVLFGRTPYFQRAQFFETKNDREIVEKYLCLTGISNLADKMMNQLSGGEKQMAQIAKALTQEADLILLDEPISHLDIAHQIKVMDLLQKLNEEIGLTVIIVLHDLNIAGEYCEKLCFINNGNLLHYDIPEKVLTFENIESIYHTKVVVQTNPYSKKPYVIPITAKMSKKNDA